jgi:glycosyltransferase involved in cell wall biosynthesis/peptidoglycan hydrolase CwlO-like protein
MRNLTLRQLYEQHQGKVSDKWSIYLTEYDRILSPYRDKPVRLLEIGIQNGGSLEIWGKYFALAHSIVGCDINPDCAKLVYTDPCITVVVGDANSDETEQTIAVISPNFDVIIDDGSHRSGDIIRSFVRYFPHLAHGGFFVAEDLHCSYWAGFQGGLFHPASSVAFFKRLADVVSYEHWGLPHARKDILASFSRTYDIDISEEMLSHIHSIEFINSLCVIRKSLPAENVLGDRFVSGKDESVVEGILGLQFIQTGEIDERDNQWSLHEKLPEDELEANKVELAQLRPLQKQLPDLNQAIIARDSQIISLNQIVDGHAGQIGRLSQTLAERMGQIEHLNQTLAERNGQIGHLNQTLIERNGQIEHLNQTLAERNRQIDHLNQTLAERNGQIGHLNQTMAERNGQIEHLNRTLAERNGQIEHLNQTSAERNGQINYLDQTLVERNGQINYLNQAGAERDGQINYLNQVLAERDGQISFLNQIGTERDGQIIYLNRVIAERDGQINYLNQSIAVSHDHAVAECDGQINSLNHAVAEREGQVNALNHTIAELRNSTSWKATMPIRFVGRQLLRIRTTFRAMPYAISMTGGYRGLLNHVWYTYKKEGVNGVKRRILFSASPGAAPPVIDYDENKLNDYPEWVRRYDNFSATDREKIKNRINQLPYTPLISVVMPVYNPPLEMLKDAIKSVKDQLYLNWELCIADDASTDRAVRELLKDCAAGDSRIKLVFREKNGHISAASNSALGLATGDYIALFDNDDLLPEHALFYIAQTIVDHPDAGLIYSDEDKIDATGTRYNPYFKSDWNPDLFLSHNMICHLGVYRADLVRELGGFREGYEGAQDYDLALRCTELLAPEQILHIPKVLYHWRSHPGSTAKAGSEKKYALSAGERALNDHFARISISAKSEMLDFGMYRAHYILPNPSPLVSLIIPTRNGLSLVKQCINSIVHKTTYKNYEIIIVDNNSDDPETLAYLAEVASDSRIHVLRDERPFNFSALNNSAVSHARGTYLGLINNDIEVISPQWLDEMMSLAAQPGVGAVGARLWYPNDTLQHGGVISGIGGVAGHSHKHLPRGNRGYFSRAQLIQTMSVVTAACLVIKKSIYREVAGLDEINLKIAFNDVDFCLRVREAGYRNIWTPYAELYHHESATRGFEDTPEKQARFRDEVIFMQKRWGDNLQNDPAYNPNLTLEREDFSLAWPPRSSL